MKNVTKEYLEKKFGGIDKELKGLRGDMKKMREENKQEFAMVRQTIENEIQNLAGITVRHFEEMKQKLDVTKRVDRLEHEFTQLKQGLQV